MGAFVIFIHNKGNLQINLTGELNVLVRHGSEALSLLGTNTMKSDLVDPMLYFIAA